VAGVAALVLARNPQLRWDQVKDMLERSCDRIDTAGGQYDAAGRSVFYGLSRINARKAVDLAMPLEAGSVVTAGAVRTVAIADLTTARITLRIG
jgi:subtilisin family serine protease